eukprot:TRINITY_DN6273_c0_g2_i1.p1 TRINITY_DN6273_c0_g2~~TRINITY_DN6273_c0_g2_i1.p1  ORF type:complete len:289 (-),score=25.69 TRINITY_DN6273_c0_g2_i1:63-929(-)
MGWLRAFVLFAGLLGVAYAQPCSEDVGLNQYCVDKSRPYCVNIVHSSQVDQQPSYECRECSSNCDCKLNHFCSLAPGEIGTCVKFEKDGDDCFPYSQDQLESASFPDELKCAALYRTPFNATSDQIRINQRGICVGGTCRTCAHTGTGGIPSCNLDKGTKEPRVCGYPGTQVNPHSQRWHPGNYNVDPRNAWWAIFFVMFITFIAIQTITLAVKFRKAKLEKPHMSTHMSEMTPQVPISVSQETPHASAEPRPYDEPPVRSVSRVQSTNDDHLNEEIYEEEQEYEGEN